MFFDSSTDVWYIDSCRETGWVMVGSFLQGKCIIALLGQTPSQKKTYCLFDRKYGCVAINLLTSLGSAYYYNGPMQFARRKSTNQLMEFNTFRILDPGGEKIEKMAPIPISEKEMDMLHEGVSDAYSRCPRHQKR